MKSPPCLDARTTDDERATGRTDGDGTDGASTDDERTTGRRDNGRTGQTGQGIYVHIDTSFFMLLAFVFHYLCFCTFAATKCKPCC